VENVGGAVKRFAQASIMARVEGLAIPPPSRVVLFLKRRAQ
jgi:hypothetical protein